MTFSQLPALLSGLLAPIAAALERRSAPRLLRRLAGALFARGRRTVTSWFRAAGITTDFRRSYCALWAAGVPDRAARAIVAGIANGKCLQGAFYYIGQRYLARFGSPHRSWFSSKRSMPRSHRPLDRMPAD